MKKISDMFTHEEKKQLSYLGSMLQQKPTEEEQEQQRVLDAWVDARGQEHTKSTTELKKPISAFLHDGTMCLWQIRRGYDSGRSLRFREGMCRTEDCGLWVGIERVRERVFVLCVSKIPALKMIKWQSANGRVICNSFRINDLQTINA
jgi:hypothetical protein